MNITERAAIVLQQIDEALEMAEKATPGPWEVSGRTIFHYEPGIGNRICDSYGKDSAFIAASRTGWPKSLRALKTAIESMLGQHCYLDQHFCGCTTANEEGDRDICNRCVALDQSEQSITTLCDQWSQVQ